MIQNLNTKTEKDIHKAHEELKKKKWTTKIIFLNHSKVIQEHRNRTQMPCKKYIYRQLMKGRSKTYQINKYKLILD